ncbi:MAG: DUF6599 family protein [Candidatus Zixiibacteriota bacterium]
MTDLLPRDMSGWTLQEPVERYDRETIFDYINGAGEVYLMYGFREVVVGQYVKPEASGITVELFDMGSAEDAYGIFSHAREHEDSGIGEGYEYKGSLLCFWKGRYFVCTLAQEETSQTKEAVFALARAIDARIEPSGGKPRIIAYLPEEGLDPHTIRFFHLHPALNYHYFLSTENTLNLSRETNAVLAKYEDGSLLLIVEYPSADDAAGAHDGFVHNYIPQASESGVAQSESGKWVAARRDSNYLMVVFEAAAGEDAVQLIKVVSERLGERD